MFIIKFWSGKVTCAFGSCRRAKMISSSWVHSFFKAKKKKIKSSIGTLGITSSRLFLTYNGATYFFQIHDKLHSYYYYWHEICHSILNHSWTIDLYCQKLLRKKNYGIRLTLGAHQLSAILFGLQYLMH
jgi:hypothetical protein